MKISEFVELVQFDSKKRTGVVLADGQFRQVVKAFEEVNVTVIDCADHYQNNLLLTDDQLVNKVRSIASDKAVLVLNLELFIAPRMHDGFLEQFVRKMAAEEPRHALVMLFYSGSLFKKFDQFYQRIPSTQSHTLDLSEENSLNTR